jgi:hypothetical protein
MRLCQVIFSTNRPEYLVRTLNAQQLLDTSGCQVDKIFFDDYPKDRDGLVMTTLATDAGYEEIYLHDRNMSIGATWEECWAILRERDYDYVWHQEDDVELLERVSVASLVDVLLAVPTASQVVLKRQPWYAHEEPSRMLSDDLIFDGFRGEFGPAHVYFTPIASLYPMSVVRFDYRAWYKAHYPQDVEWQTTNVNEAMIGKALLEGFGLRSLHLKNKTGGNLIRHIGDYTQGRKLLPGEPGYPAFAGLDPEVKYRSGTGQVYS